VNEAQHVAHFNPLDRTETSMQLGYLADHQDFIPILAQWHHREWAYLRPGDSVEARIARLRGYCGHREIPTVVVSFADGALLGSAMLVAHDMDTRMDLSPWLAGVFVASEHRGNGFGVALVRRIIDDATALGVRRLYLYTPSTEQFYSRLGWSLVERTSYRGANVVVMSYECSV
jgi:GNAT superfamily N-acetyltransferase